MSFAQITCNVLKLPALCQDSGKFIFQQDRKSVQVTSSFWRLNTGLVKKPNLFKWQPRLVVEMRGICQKFQNVK